MSTKSIHKTCPQCGINCSAENQAKGFIPKSLIAAAPELLEALKGLLADIEDYQRINNLGGFDNQSQVNARALIKKLEDVADHDCHQEEHENGICLGCGN